MKTIDAGTPVELIAKSATHSWEAMMVAFFCVVVVGLLVYIMRSWMNDASSREARMMARIDDLEKFTRTTMLEALRDNNKVVAELTAALHQRSCLMAPHEQSALVTAIVAKVGEHFRRPA